MSGVAFTPGPWRTSKWSGRESGIVAEVDGQVSLVTGYALDRDAHLIAAAPDLYEALKAASLLIPQGARERHGINAALAKAEGRS